MCCMYMHIYIHYFTIFYIHKDIQYLLDILLAKSIITGTRMFFYITHSFQIPMQVQSVSTKSYQNLPYHRCTPIVLAKPFSQWSCVDQSETDREQKKQQSNHQMKSFRYLMVSR